MSVGSTKPLEDAYRISQLDIVDWTAELLDLERLDALQLVSQTVQSPTANVVDTVYSMVARMDKQFLPGATAFDGVHDRLRQAGAKHLATR